MSAGAVASWRSLIGPTNSDKARADAPQSLRAQFGTDGTQNACHGSDAPDTAAAEIGFFFQQPGMGKCDLGANTTLCIVKPHAVKAGLAGQIIAQIQQVSSCHCLHVVACMSLPAGRCLHVVACMSLRARATESPKQVENTIARLVLVVPLLCKRYRIPTRMLHCTHQRNWRESVKYTLLEGKCQSTHSWEASVRVHTCMLPRGG